MFGSLSVFDLKISARLDGGPRLQEQTAVPLLFPTDSEKQQTATNPLVLGWTSIIRSKGIFTDVSG